MKRGRIRRLGLIKSLTVQNLIYTDCFIAGFDLRRDSGVCRPLARERGSASKPLYSVAFARYCFAVNN